MFTVQFQASSVYEPLRMDGTPQQSLLYEVHLEKLTNF